MAAQTLNPEKWLPNFGLPGFRPGQRHVIDAILDGRDTLCIMPTGGGKSLCFQLPTIARPGMTIVISPLIALMKDQVDSLVNIGIPATYINSSLSIQEQQSRQSDMVAGKFKLVYIAPERLRSNSFMRAIDRIEIQLLAVDEAHCISHWGHDFRPDYARLGRFRKKIGNPQTVALTATATKIVQNDIAKILDLDNPSTFVTGFSRENLALKVESPNGNAEKDQRLIEFLKKQPGAGIIYASTRKNCEHLVELLSEEIKQPIAFYHGGLPTEQRRKVQESFMSGETPVIVATNAFGMGIDKADLRFVIHYNFPGSIEAYYQEAGRAGRDGKQSECLLLYSYQDKFMQEFFIENSYPSRETIRDVYEYLRSIPKNPIEMTLQEIKDELGLSIGTTGIATSENLLEKAKAIERLDSKTNSAAVRIDSELTTLVDMLPREATSQRHVMRGLEKIVGTMRGEFVMFQPPWLAEKLEMKWDAVNRAIREIIKIDAVTYVPPFRGRAIHMLCPEKRFAELDIDFPELARRQQAELDKLQSVIRFATTKRCRQLEILEYFGDPDRRRCGSCDNCVKRPASKIGSAANSNVDACMYAAQVALSGVARTHGRIGKTMIAQMLKGSNSKKVKQMGLQNLSTFGLLKVLRLEDLSNMLEFLVEQGFIHQIETTKFRPVMQISPSGKSLMAGEEHVDVTATMPGHLVNVLSLKLKGKKPHLIDGAGPTLEPESKNDAEDQDFESGAEESDSSAPLTVAYDEANSVEDFSNHEPASVEPVFSIKKEKISVKANSGSLLFDDLGDEDEPNLNLLEAPSGEQANEPANEPDQTSSKPESPSGPKSGIRVDQAQSNRNMPNFYWTWKLLVDGYTAEQIEEVRQISSETLVDHVLQAAENDLLPQAEWLLSKKEINQFENFVAMRPTKRVSALISELPPSVQPNKLLIFLKCASGN